jgi:hypothetical protein
MLLLSVIVGAVTGFAGMYVSYYADIASGATITLVATALFAAAYARALVQGRLGRRAAAAESHPAVLAGPALSEVEVH